MYPRLAQHDLMVWKKLRKKSVFSWKWFAPYMGTRWHFGVEKQVDVADELPFRDYTPFVHEGLHAYYDGGYESCRDGHNKLFPAIIPKGSLFWIGSHREVVSNRLTVYRKLPRTRGLLAELTRYNCLQHPIFNAWVDCDL